MKSKNFKHKIPKFNTKLITKSIDKWLIKEKFMKFQSKNKYIEIIDEGKY